MVKASHSEFRKSSSMSTNLAYNMFQWQIHVKLQMKIGHRTIYFYLQLTNDTLMSEWLCLASLALSTSKIQPKGNEAHMIINNHRDNPIQHIIWDENIHRHQNHWQILHLLGHLMWFHLRFRLNVKHLQMILCGPRHLSCMENTTFIRQRKSPHTHTRICISHVCKSLTTKSSYSKVREVGGAL